MEQKQWKSELSRTKLVNKLIEVRSFGSKIVASNSAMLLLFLAS